MRSRDQRRHTQFQKTKLKSPARIAFTYVLAAIAVLFCSTQIGIQSAIAASSCTADDFATAVDKVGASLRKFNAEHGPKVAAAVSALQKKRGWSDAELEEKSIEYLHTPRVAELDAKANDLLSEIDTLGEFDAKAPPDCVRLSALKKAESDLIAVMREKFDLSQKALASAMAENGSQDRSAVSQAGQEKTKSQPKASTPPQANSTSHQPATPAAATARKTKPAAGERSALKSAPQPKTSGEWDVATARSNEPVATGAPQGDDTVAANLQMPPPVDEQSYTIDEIKAATRGFFGTISTNLASVIEYAFSNFGRPTAYVLGTEGGGAFLAGARFGKGELFMRAGNRQKVYWHGPSIGYDFGAEGSRTLFLIYQLHVADDLFRRFGGVDGSAYVLGGVGLTVLKGGPVLMAPIRTGVGLRLGANIGYVRFTRNATWNPF
ncbi:MAG: DUF1134 domain-containing protein [Hyphomicrobiaceae bacterium]|nr:DUF1134 domain-containing protein [Hyphomicrobiaceae bacterium]